MAIAWQTQRIDMAITWQQHGKSTHRHGNNMAIAWQNHVNTTATFAHCNRRHGRMRWNSASPPMSSSKTATALSNIPATSTTACWDRCCTGIATPVACITAEPRRRRLPLPQRRALGIACLCRNARREGALFAFAATAAGVQMDKCTAWVRIMCSLRCPVAMTVVVVALGDDTAGPWPMTSRDHDHTTTISCQQHDHMAISPQVAVAAMPRSCGTCLMLAHTALAQRRHEHGNNMAITWQ